MKIDHIGIFAHNTKLLASWYESVLGMKIVQTLLKEGRPPIYFLRGEEEIEVEILPSSLKRLKRKLNDPGCSHLAILVKDFEKSAKSLREKGIDLHDIRTTSHGWTVGYFQDLEGNDLELVYRPQGRMV